MCSERDFGSATRERPVDRPGICYCSVPESIQVVLRKVRILSFEDLTIVGPGASNITLPKPSSQEDAIAA
jgi:hypothetical protein